MYTWSKKEGYQVSSKGDKRFSAFYARLKDGRTIEEAYQLDIKGYRKFGNNAMLGKGKPPLTSMTNEEIYNAYLALWIQWAKENPTLIKELKVKADENNGMLADYFASTEANQAHALSDILNLMEANKMETNVKVSIQQMGVDLKNGKYPKVAFTGHRPDKIGGYDPKNPIRTTIRKRLYDGCKYLVNHCETKNFMQGMAQGLDQDAGNVILRLIHNSYRLFVSHEPVCWLHAAVPYLGQEDMWPKMAREKYSYMLDTISDQYRKEGMEDDEDFVHYVHDAKPKNTGDTIAWLDDRNHYMVDWCDLLVAIWDGSKGGTCNCIEYAKKVGKPILLFKLSN